MCWLKPVCLLCSKRVKRSVSASLLIAAMTTSDSMQQISKIFRK